MKYVFKRDIEAFIKEKLFKEKVVIIYGPRQAGKTTLAKKILADFKHDGLFINCELFSERNYLIAGRPELLREKIGDKKIVVLDEAQTIENIGILLKTFVDTYPTIQIIATGSSSFDLANKINEPLTGRAFEFTLFPLSVNEMQKAGIKIDIEKLLTLGSYPGIVGADDLDKEELLQNIATNYLYKDIFNLDQIKKPLVFENLVKKLALETGKQISLDETASALGTNKKTVERYISLLEQAFIIKRLYSFSRNNANELKKAFKIYFYDIGICNAIAGRSNFDQIHGSVGEIFENFFVMERIKYNHNNRKFINYYFWRNYAKNEIDLVEDGEGKLKTFECKWNEVNFTKSQHVFLKEYEKSETYLVNKNNFQEFLS